MGLKYEMLENRVKGDVKYEEFQVEGDINISTIENLMTFNFDQRSINDALFLLFRYVAEASREDANAGSQVWWVTHRFLFSLAK